MKYVTVDELIKAMHYDREQYKKGFENGYKKRNVEIVRCKDCKHRNQYNECVNLYADCESDSYNLVVDDDWFCADGERRSDG